MFKKLVSLCIVLGLCCVSFGSVGCSKSAEVKQETTPRPATKPTPSKMDMEVPPDV